MSHKVIPHHNVKALFYKTLFDDGEWVCFTGTPYGVDSAAINPLDTPEDNYFCINPLNGTRRDSNVAVFRNILIEMDKGGLDEQWKVIIDSKVPFSTIVFSGKKSLHVIISLETPLTNINDYKKLTKRIYAKMGGKEIVDTSVGNPSRLSRSADVFRDGVEQTCHYIKSRVSNQILNDWLGPELESIVPNDAIPGFQKRHKLLSSWTQTFLRWGAEPGEWNNKLFMATCDMARAGYDKARITELCESITGILDSKDRSTIDSAFRTVIDD